MKAMRVVRGISRCFCNSRRAVGAWHPCQQGRAGPIVTPIFGRTGLPKEAIDEFTKENHCAGFTEAVWTA